MVGAVDKRLPLTCVTRVRFPYLPSHVGWVCCWLLPYSKGFSPSTKTNTSKFNLDVQQGHKFISQWLFCVTPSKESVYRDMVTRDEFCWCCNNCYPLMLYEMYEIKSTSVAPFPSVWKARQLQSGNSSACAACPSTQGQEREGCEERQARRSQTRVGNGQYLVSTFLLCITTSSAWGCHCFVNQDKKKKIMASDLACRITLAIYFKAICFTY